MKSIALIGLMGSGKSTIGAILANKLNLKFVDIDAQIEAKVGTTITEIFAQKGEDFFRQIESEVLYDFAKTEGRIISTGGGAVQNENNLKTLQNNCITIYLKTSPEVLFERVKNDNTRPLLHNENPLEILRELFKKREANYQKAAIIVVTDGKTTDEIVKEIIKNVKS